MAHSDEKQQSKPLTRTDANTAVVQNIKAVSSFKIFQYPVGKPARAKG